MGDPVLALKYFCLFVAIWIVLWLMSIFAKNYRILFGKIKMFPSNLETYLFLLLGLDTVLCILCLLWTIIAWIIS